MASVLDTLISDAQKAVGQGSNLLQNAQALASDPVGSTFREAAFWTAFTPKVGLSVDDLRRMMSGQKAAEPQGGAATQAYLRVLKPVARLQSPMFGTHQWAPYGVPSETQWKKTLTTIGLSTAAFLLGYTVIVYSAGRAKGRKES